MNSPRTKTIKCNFPGCEREFETELDKNGVPYKRRCPLCSIRVKNANMDNKFCKTGSGLVAKKPVAE